MIDPAQIPDEVVEAAARTLAGSAQINLMAWNAHARAAIAAALNSWPALEVCYFLPQGKTITLPFPNVSKYPRKEGDA